MVFLEQTIGVLQQEKKKLIDELATAKEENDQLSNLLIEHSNKSTQVTSELQSKLRISEITIESLKQVQTLMSKQADSDSSGHKSIPDDEKLHEQQVTIEKLTQQLQDQDVTKIMFMIEIERLHRVIFELAHQVEESRLSVESEKIGNMARQKTIDDLNLEKDKMQSQIEDLTQKIRQTELTRQTKDLQIISEAVFEPLKQRPDTTVRGSFGPELLPNLLGEDVSRIRELEGKVSDLKIENENIKNLLATSLKDNEILNAELGEQKTLYEAQVNGINEKMEEFIRNRILEELKDYKNEWVKEKDVKDKLIDGQKKLIGSLKDKVKTLTNDLKELTELKERESLVLSRLEKKGCEMADIELDKDLQKEWL